MNDESSVWCALVVGLAGGLLIGVGIAINVTHNTAIEKGHARYDQTSGKFTWNDKGDGR